MTPEVPLPDSHFTYDEMEAALCIWEELDRRSRTPDDDEYPALKDWRGEYGTSALRCVAIKLVAYVEAIYRALPPEEWDGIAYDWEIVPAALDYVYWGPNETKPMLSTEASTARLLMLGLRGER